MVAVGPCNFAAPELAAASAGMTGFLRSLESILEEARHGEEAVDSSHMSVTPRSSWSGNTEFV